MFRKQNRTKRSGPGRQGILSPHRRADQVLIQALEPRVFLTRIVYVDDSAPVGGNGSSWALAYTDLQAALTTALAGDEIRVGQGTYTPTTLTNRTATFGLVNAVGVYGGFSGYGASDPDARDVGRYVTILSGDIGVVGNNSDNSYHVVTAPSQTNASAVLDGVTVTAGNANGSLDTARGGGMYCPWSSSPTVSNCTFSGNSDIAGDGAGMFNESSSSPTVANCTFVANSGGGMSNWGPSSPTITNCTFAQNTDGGMYNRLGSFPKLDDCTFTGNFGSSGAGVSNDSSSPTLTNCTFSENKSDYDGGGMHNQYSSPTLLNCIFTRNSATSYGGGVFSTHSAPTLTNCTFDGNSAPTGGGVNNYYTSSPTLTNCVFTRNSATTGAGIYNRQVSSPTLTNCTFSDNFAASGGGIYNTLSSSPSISNCVLWQSVAGGSAQIYTDSGSPVIAYGDIQGWTPDQARHTIASDPQFTRTPTPGPDGTWGTSDDDYGDLRLQLTSPCIDAGSNSAVPSGITTDFASNPRFSDVPSVADTGEGTAPIVDLGAFEAFVDRVSTGTAVSSSASPSVLGQSVTFTATITPVSGSGPTGTIQFRIDGGSVGAPVSVTGGTATYATSALAAGSHSVVAVYSGDGSFAGSTSPAFSQTVSNPPNQKPNAPTNASPAGGATNVALTPTLSASAFSDPDNSGQYAAQWVIRRVSDNAIVFDSAEDTTDQSSCPVPAGKLAYSTAYTWQARYEDNRGPRLWSDYSSATSFTTAAAADTTPPTPNPSTWATAPQATGTTSISMAATTANDAEGNGVEYFFHCLTAGGHDSGWQAGATYEDTGLSPNTTYTYQVMTRDQSATQNQGIYSASASAATQQVPAPSTPSNPTPPNSATLVSQPAVLSWSATSNTTSYDCWLNGQLAQNVTNPQWTVNQTFTPGVAQSWYVIAKGPGGNAAGPAWQFTVQVTPPPTPYPGPNPAPVPGQIEVENFNKGGDGVGYHDLTAGNAGAQYRTSESVDIEKCSEGGHDVGWNQPGEWLGYMVNVVSAGSYNLDLRLAYGGANANGGTVHLECDGADVTGAMVMPNTGGWAKWQTLSKSGIALTAGPHVLRLVFDKDGAGSTANTAYLGNVNWFKLALPPTPGQQTPYPGPNPAAVPGTIELENFDNGGEGLAYHDLTVANQGGKGTRGNGVDIGTCSEGGLSLGYNQPGEWLKYTVNVASAGTYSLDIRAAYGGTNANGGTVHLECDGVDVSGPITLPKTGGWATWQTVTKTGISLTAGQHVLKLAMDKDGADSTAATAYLADMNWLKLSLPAPQGPTAALADPRSGASIDASILNARKYIDVTYSSPNALDASSITDTAAEFTLMGTAANGVVVNGAGSLVSGSTYRYSFSGSFGAGPVSLSFTAGSFADSLGNLALAGTAKFTVVSLTSADIGAVGLAGSSLDTSGVYTVQGSGANILGTADGFRFVCQSLTGDGTIIARVDSISNTDPWAKAGVMIRETLAADAKNAYMAISPTSGTAFQARTAVGGTTSSVGIAATRSPFWVKLVRAGNTFTGYQSADGIAWVQTGAATTISMGSTVYIGLASTSHNNSTLGTSVFSNVQIS